MLRCRLTGTDIALLPAGMTRLLRALIFMAAAHSALATTWTWTGNGGTSLWGTAANWNIGSAPTSNSATDLIFSGTNNVGTSLVPLSQTIANPFQLNSITFNGTAGSFFLGGNALSFTGASNTIVQSSSNAQSIDNDIGSPGSKPTTLTLTGNGSGIVTLSGIISVGGGGRDYVITKTGTSSFTLSGVNTYGGLTTISAGVLNIQNSAALGSTATGTLVSSGAALQIQGGIGVGSEALVLNGSGIANDGALRNISGTNSYGGAITFGSASTISSDAGTLTLSSTVNNGGFLFTESGAGNLTISGIISGTGGLTKSGAGTLTLGAVNTFSGGSILNGGTVVVSGASGLGATAGSTTINAATLDIAATFASTRSVVLGSASSTLMVDPTFTFTQNIAITGTGSLNKTGTGTLTLGTANTYSGGTNINAGTLKDGNANAIPNTSAVTVAAGATFDLNSFSETIGSLSGGGTVTSGVAGALRLTAGGDNTSTLFSGILQNGSGTVAFTKTGTGTLTLSGANTYSGLTTVSAGTLDIWNAAGLGTTAGGTTVSNGATLQFQNGITIGAEPLTLNGSGNSAAGALRNFAGSNSVSGAITLGSASTINSDAGTLTLTGGIVNGGFIPTFGGAGNISETGVVSGTGGLTKTGNGTLTLSGANTYSGTTAINGGTVIVSSDGNLGGLTSGINLNAGTLEIATGFTTGRSITLGDAASTFQVDAGQTFTVSLALLGPGTLNKTGSGTMVLSAMNLFSGGTNVVAGTLRLGAIDRLLTTAGLTISGGTFDLQTFGQTSAAVTLSSGSITGSGTATLTGSSFTLQSGSVSAILGGNATVTKNTAGSVTLSGSNTFTGSTTVSVGTLQVTSNNALGTTASGTTVANGAVLSLNNVNYTTAEPLTINGTGITNGGALRNSGTSTFAGPINAATNATINAGGGTLNLTGGLSKNGTTLTIAGGGTVNVTTNGITGSAANSDLVVDGTTVVLSAASSYNGPTTIQNSGTLKLGNSNVLPTTPQTAMTINTNSTFDLATYSDGVASLTGDTTATVKNSVVGGTSTLTVNPSTGVSTTFAGAIKGNTGGTQGDIALVKNGSGTLILTGANTYGGSTTINGGTVNLAATSGSAAGSTASITVNSGGTLALGNSDQINNAAPMTLAGGTFMKGNFSEGTATSTGLGALTLTAIGGTIDFGTGTVGTLTFASFTPGSFTLTVANWTGTAGTVGTGSTDRLIFASDQTANLSSFSFNGYAGAMQIALGGYYEVVPVTAVPEATTWIAAGLALVPVGFHILRRRRRRVTN